MKRFTETTKWQNPWFRRLTPTQKCLWLYLTDMCDAAGVIEQDLDGYAFHIGAKLTAADLTALDDNLRVLESGKLWLPKFIRFQYRSLSSACAPHRQVFDALARNGLTEADLSSPERVSEPFRKGFETLKDKDKDKDKSKDKDKGQVALAIDVPNPAEQIWALYPKKARKQEAMPVIVELLKSGVEFEHLFKRTSLYAGEVAKWPVEERRFVPDGVRWFKHRRFDDDATTWVRVERLTNNRIARVTEEDHSNGF